MTIPPVPSLPSPWQMPTVYDADAIGTYSEQWQQRDAAWSAQVDDLKAQLAALQPTAPSIAFGVDLSDLGPDGDLTEAQKVASHRALGLPLTNVRVFFGGGRINWSAERIRALDPTRGDSVLISTLSTDIAGLTADLKNTPDEWRGHVRIAHGHEREADLTAAGQAAIDDWLAYCERKATMLDGLGSYGYSSDDFAKIGLWYSQQIDSATKGTRERFYGGQDFGAFGEDCYHYQYWLNKLDRYATPEELFGPITSFCAQVGRPCIIPEWGGTLAKTDTTGQRRAQAITDGGNYLKEKAKTQPIVAANWWCATGSKDSSQPSGYRNHHLEQVAGSSSPELRAFLALL